MRGSYDIEKTYGIKIIITFQVKEGDVANSLPLPPWKNAPLVFVHWTNNLLSHSDGGLYLTIFGDM